MIKTKYKGLSYFIIVNIILLFFQIYGYVLQKDGVIDWNVKKVLFLVFASLFGGALLGIWGFLLVRAIVNLLKKHTKKNFPLFKNINQLTFISFGINALCFLPYYLAYFPGLATYDSPAQFSQALFGGFVEHHPIAHTLLIKAFLDLGKLINNDINTGIAIFCFVQMLALAFCLAMAIRLLAKMNFGKKSIVIAEAFIALFPVNAFMAISITKDTIFTIFVVLMIVSLIEFFYQKKEHSLCDYIKIFVCIVGASLFRANGIYAAVVSLVTCVIILFFTKKASERKTFIRLFILIFFAVIVSKLSLMLVFNLTNAEQGDKREMLSVPIQQMARTAFYHQDELTDEELNLVDSFILDKAYNEYAPSISDPVKRHTNTYVVRYRIKDFAKTYFNLLKKYPGEFFDSVMALDSGYLYIGDVTHAAINLVEGRDGMGYIQTKVAEETIGYGYAFNSKWPSLRSTLEKFAGDNLYLNVPILKHLVMPGIYLWVYLILLGVLLNIKPRESITIVSFIAGLYLTNLLGPCVQLRYMYPIMLCLLPIAAFVYKTVINETEE